MSQKRFERVTGAAIGAIAWFALTYPEATTNHNMIDIDHPFWKFTFPERGYVIILEVDRDDNPTNLLCRTRFHQPGGRNRHSLPLRDPIREVYVFTDAQMVFSEEHGLSVRQLQEIVQRTMRQAVEAAEAAVADVSGEAIPDAAVSVRGTE
ncbi:MAG TPA: hypothetical protein VF272_02555 [Candidatus Saccharimonadia bacterium]